MNKLVMTGGEVANCVRAMVMTCAGAQVEPKLRLDARRMESSSKENWAADLGALGVSCAASETSRLARPRSPRGQLLAKY